jgi:CheY-like chemotaxis protein
MHASLPGFSVNQPIAIPQAERPLLTLLGGELPQIQGNILVVEDEGFVREVTAEILEAAGYHVVKARTAAEALAVFHECGENVDLLVTDVVLPGRNGCELARELRQRVPQLRTVLISGYPENAATRNAEVDGNGGRTTYLQKPFSVESLLRSIRAALAAG